jgi:hypothetical protein
MLTFTTHIISLHVIHSLGQKPNFSTMCSITFQLSFIVENIKLSIAKCFLQLKNDIVD